LLSCLLALHIGPCPRGIGDPNKHSLPWNTVKRIKD
jgi:hypothetical protein